MKYIKIFLGLILSVVMASNAYGVFPYSVTRTPLTGDTILVDDLNISNSEHINNNIPESIDDLSTDVTEMGSTKDPFVGDTEVLSVTLAEELQELRHAIDQLKKKFNTSATKWYHDTTDEGVLWVTGSDVVANTATPFITDGRRVDVTGTTTITSFDAVGVGTLKTVEFTGALTLTHHTTNLRLPNATNIVTIAGDIGVFHEYAAGDWELVAWSGHELAHTHANAANGGSTLTAPTISSPVINTAISGSAFLDEDNMSSDSATKVASQQSIKAYVDSQTGSSVPPGIISSYGGSSAPSGYLLCDGAVHDAVADTSKQALFDIIGNTFGGADNTDFQTPDLRGRFPLGKDNMGGSSANRVTDSQADNIGQGSGAEDKLIAHVHNIQLTSDAGNNQVAAKTGTDEGFTPSESAGSGSSSMNPYLTLNYIIKK